MGGKTKQRVKNNAKPSSSSRSAELLGSTGFVGFAATDTGMLPMVPGFSTCDSIPETFDVSISPEFQLVLRKMSKKDPMTKKKALNEFIELINKSDMEANKAILPLWPRHYHNLATDPEHIVRELSQTALKTLLSKCKRAVAPFLKQLVPIWLCSQFDNYAPAASIAVACFKETFVGSTDRTQEVLLHCQNEIIEHATRNLTFHTAATLSSGKDLAPEEAEQKYQRAVVSSLKALSFLIEKTNNHIQSESKTTTDFKNLIEQQKFWSLSKNKTSSIRAAWFEFVYQLLQSPNYKEIIAQSKVQLTTLSFQNIDESDAAVASFAWGCVILIQSNYNDWYSLINLRKVVIPKLTSLLRNGFNRNATILCPNLLPFFSKMTPETLQDINYFDFNRNFFNDFKHSICNEVNNSKIEMNAIIKSYFECLRYIFQKLDSMNDELTNDAETFGLWLLNENLIETIKWLLDDGKITSVKYYFQQFSSLIAFWAGRCCHDPTTAAGGVNNAEHILYKKLIEIFWQRISVIIKEIIENEISTDETCMERVIELLQNLYVANPNLEGQRIKFRDNENCVEEEEITLKIEKTNQQHKEKNKLLEKELKKLATQLVCLFLQNINAQNSTKYIKYLRSLTQLFTDNEFHKTLSTEGTTLASLNIFKNLFETVQHDEETSELLINIIFEILQNLEISESLEYIKALLKDAKKNIKVLILQRLLSYPYCNEPDVRSIISEKEMSLIILEIAHEALFDNTKEKFNILHKCFFQIENGDILIDRNTVDGILQIICEAIFSIETKESIDACSSFLAQTMPVFCVSGNASKEIKEKVFLHLFEFTMKHLEADDYISEETLWEITTCWQDALSSGDICIDKKLLNDCFEIIEKYSNSKNLKCSLVESMADALSKFIICSTEYITEKEEKIQSIDNTISVVFNSSTINEENLNNLKDLCSLLEATKCIGTTGNIALNKKCLHQIDIQTIFRRILLNLTIIKKLICKTTTTTTNTNSKTEEECSEDYCNVNTNLLTQWSTEILDKVLEYFCIAAVGESFLTNNLYPLTEEIEEYVLSLSETVKYILSNDTEMITILIEELLNENSKKQNVSFARALQFLVNSVEYSQFEESATIVLMENLTERFIGQGAFDAYVFSLLYLLPKLSPKALTLQSAIMQSDPKEIWIRAVLFRCLIKNNFENIEINENTDKAIALAAFQFMTNIVENNQQTNKEYLLYNTIINNKNFADVNNAIEYINLFCELLKKFPYQLTLKNWDALRLGLSSWTLSVSKSFSNYTDPKVFLFVGRVFKLYETLKSFILSEKQKSSTAVIKSVIEEWESLFAREVELVLFNFFFKLVDANDGDIDYECFGLLMEHIVPSIELIDFDFIYSANRELSKLDHLCSFLLKNLSNPLHSIRTCCAHILRQLTKYFVASDVLTYEKSNDTLANQAQFPGFHFLNNFDDYMTRYGIPIKKYIDEFSFKLTEINDFGPIDREEALSYLLLWDCIIYVCANSPLSLRSIYTNWIHENRYEENYFHFIFRCMPTEILKNHDSKIMSNDVFKGLTYLQIKDPALSLEKYACHLFTETLRKLPAMARKWWNTCPSRQKTFVDKLTTNFVSPLICHEELRTITNRKEKHENMQVTVHNSTREVLAVYSIDEARMELVITLAANYPLGSVKVECGKQIGGRGSSRNIGMQLSIFLTHQNGTICDGLTLWKNNLDKKFDGVEECYICYTVIHQETCQLPRISCKTCTKKFHGPCLYKWFTTSSKSTCPICRNVFQI